MRWFCGLLLFAQLALPLQAGPRQIEQLIPDLSLRTAFAYDRGDELEAIVFRGEEYPVEGSSSAILSQLGWASRPDRLELAQAWIEDIALFGSEVIRPGDSRYPGYEGPQAITLPNGTIRYTAWATSLLGRNPGSTLTKWQVDIDTEGRVAKTALETVGSYPGSP